MRIDGFQNIPAVLRSLGAGQASKSPAGKSEATSSVSLSAFAEVMQSLQRESLHASQVRGERISELAKQAESGKLSVNIEKLAQSLIEADVIHPKG
jgi:anti-sigma28 factor (negative regulator of flagellin synthesis)